MPSRSRASTSRPVACSTMAKANMPRKWSTQSVPHCAYALPITSVSEVEKNRCPWPSSSARSCLVVVDAAVEDDGQPQLGVDHRLRARGADRSMIFSRRWPSATGPRAHSPQPSGPRALPCALGRAGERGDVRRRPSNRISPPVRTSAGAPRPSSASSVGRRSHDPGVLGPAAARGVHHHAALGRDPGQRQVGDRRRRRARCRSGRRRPAGRRGGAAAGSRPASGARTAHDLLRDPAGRVGGDLGAALRDLGGRGVRADQHPGAAVAVDRLGHELADPVEHEPVLGLVARAVGRHRLQDGRSPR